MLPEAAGIIVRKLSISLTIDASFARERTMRESFLFFFVCQRERKREPIKSILL